MTYKVKKDDKPFILKTNMKVIQNILAEANDKLGEGENYANVMKQWHKQDAGKILPYGQLKSNCAYFCRQHPGFGTQGGKPEGSFIQASRACNILANLGILCEV